MLMLIKDADFFRFQTKFPKLILSYVFEYFSIQIEASNL